MNQITAKEVDAIVTEQAARMADSLALAHAEALEMERERLQACADRHRADNLPRPEYLTLRDELLDGGWEVVELDNEVIVDLGREYGLTLPQLVARLDLFLVWAREKK